MPLSVTVAALSRWPVKSLHGESLTRLAVDERGCVGDRLWSVRTANGKIGSGKNTRRFAAVDGLLTVRAFDHSGQVVVRFPDGAAWPVGGDEAAVRMSRHVGQPVTFARESEVSHFDDGPVSLLAAASVAALAAHRGEPVHPDRFRANVLLDGLDAFAEQAWVGRRVRVGTALLAVTAPSPRCVMVDAATADQPAQRGNLKAVGRLNRSELGVIASVIEPGEVAVGDAVGVE